MKYPDKAVREGIQGRVVVQFVVDTLGNVTKPKIIRSVSPELDAETIRVVKLLKRFSPGIKNGVPVSVYFSLPLTFRLTEKN